MNIMLDEKQNQLLEMGVMLTTATLVFSAGIVVVGIFGMNIGISLYDGSGSTQFCWLRGSVHYCYWLGQEKRTSAVI
ncbi:Magnesium transporter MRS2-F [Acorus calamus]|uniref:Magnesium transporter MRS2-F n=1 Tax=Acorus calamus TaxID=4465 RepID=A0AAV9CMP8_ACOCL|nr:Magnesium transporter MRS2-F [Acorus calamus]